MGWLTTTVITLACITMVLPHETASSYAIFVTHPVSPSFLTGIIAKSHTCTIEDPDVELRVIDTQDFTNWTHEQLAQWTASPDHFNNSSSPFQPSVFVVVDERSEQEDSIVIVSLDKDDLHILGTVRADPCFASVIPSLIEFNWNGIEEWQERAGEFGGVLRDTPIEEAPVDPSAEAPYGPNVWATNAGLRVAAFSDETAVGDEIWIAGVGRDTLERRVTEREEN